MEADLPTWADNLRWIVVAILLALAYLGPRIVGPVVEKLKNTLPSSPPATLGQPHLAVVGAALADRESILALVAVLERIADLFESKLELENQANQEVKARKMIRDLLHELQVKEMHTDRDKKS